MDRNGTIQFTQHTVQICSNFFILLKCRHVKNTFLEAHMPSPRQHAWPHRRAAPDTALLHPLPGWPICGYRVSHNRQNWSGLVRKEPGSKKNLPTQLPTEFLSYCVSTTCAGYMTQRLTCQDTREASSLSTSGSFQCPALAGYLPYRTKMGAQKNKIFIQFYAVQSLQYVMLLCFCKLNFTAGQDP